MKQRSIRLLLLALTATAAQAVAQPATAPASPVRRELIYCADQMSHEEREAYRAKMQATRSAAEKEVLRNAHRRDMQERARAAGREGQCQPLGPRGRGQGGGQGGGPAK
ncbi:MAG: hypothetical protein FD157_1118 [Rhodocyclaceae bacterium]|nr:MAG: hypothetical protein FD157_1118 [Rhodocyclaceae bacterium]TND06144.1 MAG: hypothetical protein FD118_216 [Rhodocyclaceae bacterium]